jgi:hypothetical protein
MVNVYTIFTNDLYPNNWAFECLTSLLNTFPWISSVCWDKWLIFQEPYSCRRPPLYDTQAYIFTWLLLQAYLSMTHTVCKHVKATHTYMYRRNKNKSEPYSCSRIPFHTGVYIYLVTTAGVYRISLLTKSGPQEGIYK